MRGFGHFKIFAGLNPAQMKHGANYGVGMALGVMVIALESSVLLSRTLLSVCVSRETHIYCNVCNSNEIRMNLTNHHISQKLSVDNVTIKGYRYSLKKIGYKAMKKSDVVSFFL